LASEGNETILLSGSEIPEVKLMQNLEQTEDIVSRTCEYFFKRGSPLPNSPFKGFLLEGPPGTGKTEIVKQATRKLDRRMGNVHWMFVDGATIASPKWGDAEKALRKVFLMSELLRREQKDPKLIIHFDDIESLMMARGTELAKEWHYSINSILFHEIDRIDPFTNIICATTNRLDLVDTALRDRLFVINVPPPPVADLAKVIKEILDVTGVKQEREKLESQILLKLGKLTNPTIRDARKLAVIECVTARAWSL
jgi:SpoVK/Ycf46/Vps4 family AAA+-type ATPase